ncbi:MAG: fibrillarin-like rRNA/tRNA 2'-O-methyltransferase [Candidatus Altiarchaeales archaeon]|nr:fibrillarin-like rRNA/tRNA 2'-O-methyltransferase [Candidatus Altiarchaeales archaeon]MBD3416599.1 fibrillarin-like rRNA/tRNA 2'-O-methyltransferase [Candidatus Altiarchaeales archaeon]
MPFIRTYLIISSIYTLMKEKFPGVYLIDRKLATHNKTPGYRVYGEKTVKKKGKEYRMWDPHRSKVAAALAKGMKTFPISPGSSVLYLGASSGTTASHIADIAETVYCVEFSKRMMRELLPVCDRKQNMIPILADARHPWEYSNTIANADVLIQDVAQPDQAGILLNNYDTFKFKHALLSIKARSINSAKDPKKVFKAEKKKLTQKFEILEQLSLEPYEEDHMLLNLKAK